MANIQIEPKYNIGKTVYYLKNTQIIWSSIRIINCTLTSFNKVYKYILEDNTEHLENQIFDTTKDLLQCIVNNSQNQQFIGTKYNLLIISNQQ